MNDQEIYQQLERLAEAFPWDRVDIWIERAPEGVYRFTAYIADNQKTGAKSIFTNGASAAEAVDDAIKQAPSHDPEQSRLARIKELEHELARLQVRQFGLPPYRAPNQLGFGKPAEERASGPVIVNIESERTDAN